MWTFSTISQEEWSPSSSLSADEWLDSQTTSRSPTSFMNSHATWATDIKLSTGRHWCTTFSTTYTQHTTQHALLMTAYTQYTRWTKKIPPLRLLLILQQCMGIFVRNFTRLLSDQIYTLSPSFIEIFLELTKLHSFNHDNPHFTVFVSMFIRMSIQCSLKFEITSITKERLLASILTSVTSVATHLADNFFLKCFFWHRVQHGKDFSGR